MFDLLKKYKNLLFLDIETVSIQPDFSLLSAQMQQLWRRKTEYMGNEASVEELYFQKAGIYAEFGKIVCIGVGYFHLLDDTHITLRVKSFVSDDEKTILQDFKTLLQTKFGKEAIRLVAHNGKEFDFPYISRRMLVNGISLPLALDNSTKKPWEIPHLDTLEMWKFGDRKHYTSLELLCAIFDIPIRKQEMNGSKVNTTYHTDHDLEKIGTYCQDDVIATAQLFLRMNGAPLLAEENIIRV